MRQSVFRSSLDHLAGDRMSAYWVAVRIEDGICGSEPFDSTEAVARFVQGRLNEGAVVEADVWTVKRYEEETGDE